jgi:hypothetical protein
LNSAPSAHSSLFEAKEFSMRSLAVAALVAASTSGVQAQTTPQNPQLSLTLQGVHSRSARGGTDADAEAEVGIKANLGPLDGISTISFNPFEGASFEEAYLQTRTLGNGFTVKGGRFLSGTGYLNSQHAHAWDFVDLPLVYQRIFDGQFTVDGAQVAWVAPTDTFIEVRGEAGRGRALALHTGGDVGDSSSWRAGVSAMDKGGQRIWIADGVWKWAPGGNSVRTSLKLQGEYLRSTRDGEPTQSGWYAQGVYQFMRYWRVGVRTEPGRQSLMGDWSPDEFTRVRLQYGQRTWSLQYILSFGAHAAHSF